MNMAQREREAAATLPSGSVLAVLYEQHARIRDLFPQVAAAKGEERQAKFDELRELLAVHEAGEEMVLRPVTAKVVSETVSDARNKEESDAARILARLEKLDVNSMEFGAMLAGFEEAMSAHATHEEDEEFPRVMAQVSTKEQQKMGERLLTAERLAPTHPHPTATGSTAAQFTVGPFVGLLDKAKDAFAARKSD